MALMPIADRNEQLQPGTPPAAPQFRHIVDALMSQPMARPRLGTGSQPMWGFHEPTVQAGAGVDAALQAAPQVLSDPRNAWFGLGPIGMAMRPVSGVGGWMRGWEKGRDLGGFKPPVGHIPEIGDIETINRIGEGLISPHADVRMQTYQTLAESPLTDPSKGIFRHTAEGLRQLKAERDMALFSGGAEGGSVPPPSIMDDLKDKYGFGYGPLTNEMSNESDMLRRQQAQQLWQQHLDRTRPPGE